MYQNKSRKIIEINPDLFTLRKTVKNKKEKKIKPKTEVKSNQIKKELLKKIKDYQKKTEDINGETKTSIKDIDNADNFEDEFNKSLNFLQELSHERENVKNKKQTLKKANNKTDSSLINLEIPIELKKEQYDTVNDKKEEINFPSSIDTNLITTNTNELTIEEKPYGCLKSGNKPTFREWQKMTQKNNNLNSYSKIEKIQIYNDKESESINDNQQYQERQYKLENIKNDFKKNKKSLSVIDRHIKTTKYTLGKTGKRVGVLIKNNITRKAIKEDITKLKKKPILEIKNYLRKHNLIKVGSNAPNDVMREIYEQSIMAGDIHNNNNNNYLFNN